MCPDRDEKERSFGQMLDEELDQVGGGIDFGKTKAFYCEDCKESFEIPAHIFFPNGVSCPSCHGRNTHQVS